MGFRVLIPAQAGSDADQWHDPYDAPDSTYEIHPSGALIVTSGGSWRTYAPGQWLGVEGDQGPTQPGDPR